MAVLFFDNDAADKRVFRQLERLGHQVTTATEQHLARESDRELLRYAGEAGLVLVMHNERDFVELHVAATDSHSGIVAVPHVAAEGVPPLVAAIDALINGTLSLAGQCYRLRSQSWERRTSARGWEALASSGF